MKCVDALASNTCPAFYLCLGLLRPDKEDVMAIEVFISYSHNDRALRDEREIHLSNLKRQGIISSWYDGDITPGTEWERQIMERLRSAQIVLLLISADFIHSDFCYSIEMKQAIVRHDANNVRVIPILLRPTDWKGAPFAKLKMLPTDAKAITMWPTHDEGFVDVIQGIREAIDDLTSKMKPVNQEHPWNIPYARNPLFTGRENVIKRLYDTLKASKTAAISGLGGIGKTQTAVEYAYRYRMTTTL
jgi:TIR domain-containing protein